MAKKSTEIDKLQKAYEAELRNVAEFRDKHGGVLQDWTAVQESLAGAAKAFTDAVKNEAQEQGESKVVRGGSMFDLVVTAVREGDPDALRAHVTKKTADQLIKVTETLSVGALESAAKMGIIDQKVVDECVKVKTYSAKLTVKDKEK